MAACADFTITPMTPGDWLTVRRIYAEGIATGNATFETDAPDWGTWNRNHLTDCRVVARVEDVIVAWAALSPVSARDCYAGIAEHSVYVATAMRGRGIGRQLLAALVADSEAHGFWMLQSGIFPENRASIAIHLACAFRIMGRRKRVAVLHGMWRDTVVVERRSAVVGI